MKRAIKEWFQNKIEEPRYFHLTLSGMHDVVKETEKAYQLSVDGYSLDGEYDKSFNIWVPKSCTLTEEEYKVEEENREQRIEKAIDYYNSLIDFCKTNGIKGARKGLRKETLLKKIADAGYTAPARN